MCERLRYEKAAYALGKSYIIGLDEAGRGPMAGPLVVAGVIFEKGYYHEAINDSKQLSEKMCIRDRCSPERSSGR